MAFLDILCYVFLLLASVFLLVVSVFFSVIFVVHCFRFLKRGK